jgi:hypothetical protein
MRRRIGLRELLSRFDIRVVPRPFIDYRVFRDTFKGIPDEQVGEQLVWRK